MKKNRRKKELIILVVILLIIAFISIFQRSFALNFLNSGTSSLEVKYNAYDELPANHVHIENLGLHNAEFSTTNSNIKYDTNEDNSLSSEDYPKESDFTRIAYYNNVNYGSANRTETTDANLATNNISGSFTLLYKNSAVLSDGKTADVKITVSNIVVKLGKNANDLTGKAYLGILEGDNNQLRANCGSARQTKKYRDPNDYSYSNVACNMDINISIVDSQTGNPIGSKYEQMLFGMYDIDTSDATLATGKTLTQRYNGDYAESVELLSGFASPIVFAPQTGPNAAMRNLLAKKNVNGNTKIYPDGALMQVRYDQVGNVDDNMTYYTGFVVPAKPQGFSFRWYASQSATSHNYVRTALYGLSGVNVTATSGEGGTIEKPGVTSYNLNSSTTYDYTPAHGYKVKSLKVNGEDVDFSEEGGTYTFRKLYKTPLVEVNDDGTTGAPLGEDYTIDVRFEEKDKIKVKYVTDNNGSIDKTEERVIEKDSPLGIVDVPSTGYKLLSIKCDNPVKLTDGTVILKNNPMTLEQLKKVIVEKPLVFTVYHKKDNAKTYNCEN